MTQLAACTSRAKNILTSESMEGEKLILTDCIIRKEKDRKEKRWI